MQNYKCLFDMCTMSQKSRQNGDNFVKSYPTFKLLSRLKREVNFIQSQQKYFSSHVKNLIAAKSSNVLQITKKELQLLKIVIFDRNETFIRLNR